MGDDGQPRQRRVPLCTLTARFLGPRLVEVPFVATRLKSQRQGHCRILISVLEHVMQQVRVWPGCVLGLGPGPVCSATCPGQAASHAPLGTELPCTEARQVPAEFCGCVCAGASNAAGEGWAFIFTQELDL